VLNRQRFAHCDIHHGKNGPQKGFNHTKDTSSREIWTIENHRRDETSNAKSGKVKQLEIGCMPPCSISDSGLTLPLSSLTSSWDTQRTTDFQLPSIHEWKSEAPIAEEIGLRRSQLLSSSPGSTLRILGVGDSITVGFPNLGDGNGYRVQLKNDLLGNNVSSSYCNLSQLIVVLVNSYKVAFIGTETVAGTMPGNYFVSNETGK
jgi:hypothetical protein